MVSIYLSIYLSVHKYLVIHRLYIENRIEYRIDDNEMCKLQLCIIKIIYVHIYNTFCANY